MQEQEFNLLDELWIRVMWPDYQVSELSLSDTLLKAHQIRDLAGEMATQDIAMLRLLLAVLHTVFSRGDESGREAEIEQPEEALRRWRALWEMQSFPEQPLRDYLAKWHDRFWLFDPEYPFYQVPGLIAKDYSVAKLNGELLESNNKVRLFSMYSGKDKAQLPYPAAARWLVYKQAFADCAVKKPSPKMSWLGSIGPIIAKGNTLFETLLLNLTLLRDGLYLWGEAYPAWEAAPNTKPVANIEELEIAIPDNQAELLTLQSRRILLKRENGAVNRYIDAAGYYFVAQNPFVEQMTIWETKTNKQKQIIEYKPKVHDKTRQIWREFASFVGKEQKHKPGVVTWVELLQSQEIFSKTKLVCFCIASVQYDKQQKSSVINEFSDTLEFHSELLTEAGTFWQDLIVKEIDICDSFAQIVGVLAEELNKAAGGKGNTAAEQAKTQFYYRLDIPFREWLLTLEPQQGSKAREERRDAWREQARRIVLNLGRELIAASSPAAFAGKAITEKIKGNDVERHYSAPEAWNNFLYRLNRWEG